MSAVEMHQQQMVPIGKLKLADYNPREMSKVELDKLMRSLSEFGFVEPVVARAEDGLVIGGHQRILAMRRLLHKQKLTEAKIAKTEIPTVYIAGVDDDRAKLLNVALNKIHGEWDYDKLAALFQDLSGSAHADLVLSGFNQVEIGDILSLSGSLDVGGGLGDDELDQAIADSALRFVFKVGDEKEAGEVAEVLRGFGMTGTSSANAAFLAAMRAAKSLVSSQSTKSAPRRRERKAPAS